MWGALSDQKSGLYFSVSAEHVNTAFLRSESHGTHEHILLWNYDRNEGENLRYKPANKTSPQKPIDRN
jgi:hypothetical protein